MLSPPTYTASITDVNDETAAVEDSTNPNIRVRTNVEDIYTGLSGGIPQSVLVRMKAEWSRKCFGLAAMDSLCWGFIEVSHDADFSTAAHVTQSYFECEYKYRRIYLGLGISPREPSQSLVCIEFDGPSIKAKLHRSQNLVPNELYDHPNSDWATLRTPLFKDHSEEDWSRGYQFIMGDRVFRAGRRAKEIIFTTEYRHQQFVLARLRNDGPQKRMCFSLEDVQTLDSLLVLHTKNGRPVPVLAARAYFKNICLALSALVTVHSYSFPYSRTLIILLPLAMTICVVAIVIPSIFYELRYCRLS